MDVIHISVETVLEIHREAITRFGGSPGLRDMNLLESAVAAPQASFGGESVFDDAIDIAASYLFYVCRNHPFVDGNKRTGLGACIVFLRLNRFITAVDGSAWEELTLAVAASEIDRLEATRRLRPLVRTIEA